MVKFENSGVIAGVRGTSIAVQGDNITIYQSQQNTGGSIKSRGGYPRDLSKCSFFNTRNKNIEPLPPPYSINRYCLSGHDDTILDFTKKDLIYLNELIATNRAPDTVHAEKSITAPQEIQSDSIFCPNGKPPIFWPDVTDPNEMCQEEKVVAVATLTPQDGKIVYKKADGTMGTRDIVIEKKNGYYGGKLTLDDQLKQVLGNTQIKINGILNNQTPIMNIGRERYTYYTQDCTNSDSNCYSAKRISGNILNSALNIAFGKSGNLLSFQNSVTIMFIRN
ncbi:hypothetical protein BLM37_02265 [Candidatus Gracilibacteria bacterium GN02-873]|nr:hypothetical protein BLM37_02265 [Candidatus Gracilibacteria bacterium GN02-873]